jgi:hypothetical protein
MPAQSPRLNLIASPAGVFGCAGAVARRIRLGVGAWALRRRQDRRGLGARP